MSSKTYTIIGRVFTKKHGYLASFTRCDYIANNDKDAIKQAKSEGRARRVLKIKNPYGLYIYKGIRLNDSHKIDWNLLNN